MVETHISPKGINRGGLPQNHVEVDCVTWRFMMLTARKDGQTWRRYSELYREPKESVRSALGITSSNCLGSTPKLPHKLVLEREHESIQLQMDISVMRIQIVFPME